MPDQRKYIVSAFVILSVVFMGVYFLPKIFSNTSNEFCGVDDTDHMAAFDTNKNNSDGKALFIAQCAACHIVTKESTGPALSNVLDKDPWLDRKNLYQFINDPEEFFSTNKYIRDVRKRYGGIKHPDYDLSEKDIDNIFSYIDMYASKVGIPAP